MTNRMGQNPAKTPPDSHLIRLRQTVFRKFYRLRSGKKAIVSYYGVSALYRATHLTVFALASVHLAYVLNRHADLEKLCARIVECNAAHKTDQRLLHVLLKAAWTLQNDDMLSYFLSLISESDSISTRNLSYIGARKSHPGMKDCVYIISNRICSTIREISAKPIVDDKLFDAQCSFLDALKDYYLPSDISRKIEQAPQTPSVIRFLANRAEANENWKVAWDLHWEILEKCALESSSYLHLADIALRFSDPLARVEQILQHREASGLKIEGYDKLRGLQYLLEDDYVSFLQLRDAQVSNIVAHQEYGLAAVGSMGINASALVPSDQSVFVIGRDGVSDEVRWSYYYRKLVETFSNVHISCDPRLQRLFRRSFPTVEFYPVARNWGRAQTTARNVPRDLVTNLELASRLDNVAFVASKEADQVMFIEDVPIRNWITRGLSSPPLEGEPAGPTLKPDPDRQMYWHHRFAQEANGRLSIGLIWRSGLVDADRQQHYLDITNFRDLLELPANFYSLQHHMTDQEHKTAAQLGLNLLDDHVDLFNDFDEIAALTSSLDLVIGVSTLPYEMAAIVGTECWLCAVSPLGRWMRLGPYGTIHDRLTSNGRVFYPQSEEAYMGAKKDCAGEIMEQVHNALRTRITTRFD